MYYTLGFGIFVIKPRMEWVSFELQKSFCKSDV